MPAALRFEDGLSRFCAALTRDEKKTVVVDVNPGRGEYELRIHQALDNAEITDLLQPLDAFIKYRTVHGIWASDRFVSLSAEAMRQELSTYADWLIPGGMIYLCVLEGEGYKLLKDQAGKPSRLQVYYQPAELEALVVSAGLVVKDAWRAPVGQRDFIHVLLQRPEK